MKKAKFFFFTDLVDGSNELTDQLMQDSFCTLESSGGVDSFLTSSVHQSNIPEPKAYAITDGKVAIHEHPNGNHVSLVLKPDVQPQSVNSHIPSIKYYIYRGVKKNTLITNNDISQPGNNIDLIDYIWSKQDDPNTVISADSIKTFIDPTLGTSTPISSSFINKSAGEAPYFEINRGESIGIFDNTGFSLEIIFDDYDYDPTLEILETIDSVRHFIEVDTLAGSANDYEKMLDRHNREEVLHYLDPASFYGSFYFEELGYKDSGSFEKLNNGEDIYVNVISKFANKNELYIDIRNEHGHSFNYYEFVNGGNSKQNAYYFKYLDGSPIKLKYEDPSLTNDELQFSEYYNNGWPLQKIGLPPGLSIPDHDKNIFELHLPKIEHISSQRHRYEKQKIYLASGYLNPRRKLRGKQPKDEDRFIDLVLNSSFTDFFGTIEIPVPNVSLTSSPSTGPLPMAWYTKILYIRQGQKDFSSVIQNSNDFPPSNFFADYLFFPRKLKLPISKTQPNQLIYKKFSSTVYVDLKREGDQDEEFVGEVGIAHDEKYTSLFIIPKHTALKSRGGIAQDLSLSENFIDQNSDSFLNYLDTITNGSLVEGELKFDSPSLTVPYYQFERGGIRLGNKPDRSFFALVFKNTNWENIKLFIEDKINTNELSDVFDISFIIKNRDNTNNDNSESETPYFSFNLFIKGFIINNGEIVPVEHDLGIKFYTNRINGGNQINLIFLDSEINDSLVPKALEKLTCPKFLLKEIDPSRPSDIFFDVPLETKTENQVLNSIEKWAETVYKEDLIDFIKYIFDEVVSSYLDGSETKYRVKSGDRHNLFLIYHYVLSKYIKVESSTNEVSVFLTKNDRNSPKAIYSLLNPNPNNDPENIPLKTYSDVYFPDFSSGNIELNFEENNLTAREPIINEGFLLEASYVFSLWKIGYTMSLVYHFLSNLDESDNSIWSLKINEVASKYPFFNNLLVSLERNKILPISKLNITNTSENKDLIKKFSLLFDDTRLYTTYRKVGLVVEGFQKLFENYIDISKAYNQFTSIDDDKVKRQATIEFYDVKKHYLNDFIVCFYEQLGGVGQNSEFFNFSSGNLANKTTNVFPNNRGAFLLNLYLKDDSTHEQFNKDIIINLNRSDGDYRIYVIHLGQYGIDSTTYVKHKFLKYDETGSSTSKIVDYKFKDFIYRLDKEGADYNIFYNTEQIGSFDSKLGDIYILKPTINKIRLLFNSGAEHMFNTVSTSEIPAPNVFSYSKSFPDFFDDDVFQIQSSQLNNIWNFSEIEDRENIDKLISILINNKPQIEVEMTGGFIGKPIIPFGYDSSINYLEGDIVLFLENSNLNIFKADTNTSNPPNSADWTTQSFNPSQVYKRGDLISHENFIYECKDDFDSNNSPFDFSIDDWIVIAGTYKEDVTYSPSSEFFNRVIKEDENGIATLYFSISLTFGKFNSKAWLKDRQVSTDQRYSFIENNNWSPNELSEEVNPPSQGSLDAIQFARLRYSHAKIIFNPNGTLKISISSFASPLISRLDNVIGTSLANPHTIYGQDDTTNAFVTSTVSGDIPSYNQLLTALRCWGILEAILERLQERANSIGSNEGSEISQLISDILDNAIVNTVISELSSNNVSSNSINYNEYLQMKQ